METQPTEARTFTPPKALLRFADLTQRISPYLGARLAYRWFLTPYPFKIPAREQQMLDRFSEPAFFTNERTGHKFPLYTFGQGSKKLLLIHGWAGRFTQFTALIKQMESSDLLDSYTIYGLNAVGHHGAEGKQSAMPIIAECIDTVVRQHGPMDHIVAHSLGCNSVMYGTQCLNTSPAEKQVFISPPGSPFEMADLFCDTFEFNTKVRALLKARLKRVFPEIEEVSAQNLARTNAVPTLVFHDTNDHDTPIEMGRAVGNAMQNGRYTETSGLGHRRILRNTATLEQIIAFLKQ